MAIDLPLFNDRHGFKILIPPGNIGQSCIDPRHFNIAVSQKLLQTFQPHACVQQFACKGMSKAMKGIAFVG